MEFIEFWLFLVFCLVLILLFYVYQGLKKLVSVLF